MKTPYKIAIMQLSRVGDIVMMLPLTRALKRTYPGCHLTMIVREKYKGALDLFDLVDDVVTLKTQDILQPFLESENQLEQTLQKLDGFIEEIRTKNIDWLINLSFSPVSADLTYALTTKTETTYTGYSRYVDGYIKFSDADAQYFFSEVGAQRENQIHLMEVFAKMTRTQLTEEDFQCPFAEVSYLPDQTARFYTFHLGASEEFKRAPLELVERALQTIEQFDSEMAFCFVGNQEEANRSIQFIETLPEALKKKCLNLCGQTSLLQLLQVMRMSSGHFGGDSLPVQISMLTGTKVFLMSMPGTNFYETGPLTLNSMVFRLQEMGQDEEKYQAALQSFVTGKHDFHADEVFYTQAGLIKWTNYQMTNVHQKESLQQLARCLYFNDDLPLIHDTTFTTGVHHLVDAHQLVLEHLHLSLQRPELIETLQSISKQVDTITEEIAKYGSHLEKVCQWIALQKSQIPPQAMTAMLKASVPVYERLIDKLNALETLGVPMSYETSKVNFEEAT
jgi:heptosyltransferase-3